ncbi:MAG: carboxypeptidase regulatory-like domain-containing protein [Methanofollis sp.]|uniref:carboxypeptidase regulatory-like domain-containing protein n=1 Tax=Methanofollis sp. TaxID=2052835 RepID=UPI00263264C2|nr:carboxypeptidase regulatory-like domain-containing protein [Methanofollis sp.]MDD4255070.1 carboxypeptidase regulatory-like domain-containing protein [Methanofollis sp.]
MKYRCIFTAIAILLIALPCSGLASDIGEKISLTVTSPVDGAEVWIDVVPPHLAVVGNVSAPSGIREVRVQSGAGEVSCGNGTTFACSVPVSKGENTITVVAVDNLGNRAEETLSVTVRIGMPPPEAITVSGRVTDPAGNPVPGAVVRFESEIMLEDNPLAATTVTGPDGRYLVENAIGYRQTITVGKEGYLPLRREVVFENLTNTLDLEMEPEGRTVPGFDLSVGVLALLLALIVRRR